MGCWDPLNEPDSDEYELADPEGIDPELDETGAPAEPAPTA